MVLNQYQDNGKTVGCLGGTASTDFATGAPNCIGGAQFVTHSINYNNWLPNASARYRIETAHSLLGKALIEAAGTASNRTRVVGRREKAETDAAR